MSAVHEEIALNALSVLPADEKRLFAPYSKELALSACYPDIFADTSMSAKAKAAIDPEADRFIYPPPPTSALQRKIMSLTEKEAENGCAPLRQAYLVPHYLRAALSALDKGDLRAATKFCGVFSHVIGDIGEPIHAVKPTVLDIVLPPPRRHIGLELHACVEGLNAPVDIQGYKPKLLGDTPARAEMGACERLLHCKRKGAALALPIVQALYAGDKKKAILLSKEAQDESSRAFADFLHTVAALHLKTATRRAAPPLDLRTYPYTSTDIDMLYRYRPLVDISLIPYSGGKTRPLSLRGKGSSVRKVKGFGVIGSLAPPFSKDAVRKGVIEYYLVPGAYAYFKAEVGVNPLFPESMVRVQFSVLADGKVVWTSPPLGRKDAPVQAAAPIAGARWLVLEIRYVDNPTSEDVARLHCDWASHAVWADPRLE